MLVFLTSFHRSTSSSGASSNPLNQLLLTAPPTTNGPTPTTKVDPKMDLLSGDDFNSPKADTLALVPVGDQQPSSTPVSNALVLMDMFSDSNSVPNSVNTHSPNVANQTNPLNPQFQQQRNFQAPQGGIHPNGSVQNMGAPQYEQSLYAQGAGPSWNGQILQQQQQQQPPSPGYGAHLDFRRISYSVVCCQDSTLHSHSFAYRQMQSLHGTSRF